MTSKELYAKADQILLDCHNGGHPKRDCEVRFNKQTIWVCCICWNRHVATRQLARKAELAESPRCEVPSCKGRGIYTVGYSGQTALLCARHKTKVLRATATPVLFGPRYVTRAEILEIAQR